MTCDDMREVFRKNQSDAAADQVDGVLREIADELGSPAFFTSDGGVQPTEAAKGWDGTRVVVRAVLDHVSLAGLPPTVRRGRSRRRSVRSRSGAPSAERQSALTSVRRNALT